VDRKRGVLFVSHEATRTGAPIALLHFLRWFKGNGDRPFAVLLPSGGELTPEFEAIADTWSVDRSKWCPGGARAALLSATGLGSWARRKHTADVRRFASRYSPGLIYANSIASAGVVDVLSSGVPVLSHVHELEYSFNVLAGPPLTNLLRGARRFVACSHAVKENLVKRHQITPERIEVIYGSIPARGTCANRTRQEILRELRFPDEALLVLGGGTHNWRKGADLFIQLARIVCQRRPGVNFVWLGSPAVEADQLEHDVRLSGLSDRLRLTGVVANAVDYLSAADLFALTSREDPYPLICLEAAALGKPIICFADAGGMPEFVASDCGFVVPYLDVHAMAARVIELIDSAACRTKMGEIARQKVRQQHDICVAAPKILEVIERTILGR